MKVAICIPCHGDTKADFTFSLSRLVAYSVRHDPALEVETLIARSSILVQSRTRLFEWSREWGADYILWLDSDHSFPPQALLRLLNHRLSIVGANYPRRSKDLIPVAVKKGPSGRWDLVDTNSKKVSNDRVEAVDRIGFGFLLMDVGAVIQALGDPLYPIFKTTSLPNGEFIGEDSLFCDRMRAGNLEIYVDHMLSSKIGHVSEEILLFKD